MPFFFKNLQQGSANPGVGKNSGNSNLNGEKLKLDK